MRRPIKTAGFALAAGLAATAVLAQPSGAPTAVRVFGIDEKGNGLGEAYFMTALRKAFPSTRFETSNPVSGEGFGTLDVTQLLLAIASGNPPQITKFDRFTVGEFAARGALEPLDSCVRQKLRPDFNWANFSAPVRREATYAGKVYVVPGAWFPVDSRILIYNKTMLREAGLDPNRPPRTWSELRTYADRLTKTGADGKIAQLGFSPLSPGNVYWYGYAFANGGDFLSADGRRATLDAPENVEALAYVKGLFDVQGGQKVIDWATARGLNPATAQGIGPFLQRQLAMVIGTNGDLNGIAANAPDIDFGVAEIPVNKPGANGNWQGGWGWAVPKGGNVQALCPVLQYLASSEGMLAVAEAGKQKNKDRGRNFYIPFLTGSVLIDRQLAARYEPDMPAKFRTARNFAASIVPKANLRPLSPVSSLLFQQQVEAVENVVYGRMTPEQAARDAARTVQEALDRFYR